MHGLVQTAFKVGRFSVFFLLLHSFHDAVSSSFLFRETTKIAAQLLLQAAAILVPAASMAVLDCDEALRIKE